MKKNLLYVYNACYDNRFTYAFTMELAKRLHLSVKTFTVIENLNHKETSEKDYNEFASNEKRKIFTHLLALHGYYQVFYNQWSPEGNPVTKNIIENGSLGENLLLALKNENIACVIIDPIIRASISNALGQKIESEEYLKDISFMVLPEKISYNPNNRSKEISCENDKDAFLDSVIGDSDLFILCNQNELSTI